MGWKNPYRKKSDQKLKNIKDQSEIAACEQKKHKQDSELLKHHFLTLLTN